MTLTEERKQCYDSLTNKGEWIVYGNDTKAIKGFVSSVMGKDYKFEIKTQPSIFGTENIVVSLTK